MPCEYYVLDFFPLLSKSRTENKTITHNIHHTVQQYFYWRTLLGKKLQDQFQKMSMLTSKMLTTVNLHSLWYFLSIGLRFTMLDTYGKQSRSLPFLKGPFFFFFTALPTVIP